jgi:hypothetical protein
LAALSVDVDVCRSTRSDQGGRRPPEQMVEFIEG